MATKITAIAFRTTSLYVILGGLWILFSDRAVNSFTSDPNLYVKLSTYKGWGFVLVTGTLLYITLRGQLRRWNAELEARRRAEGELRQNQERLQLVIENSEDVLIMQDADGAYVHYSGPKQFGMASSDVVGKRPSDLHDPDAAALILDRHRKVMATGATISSDDAIHWNGLPFWFSTRVSPARDGNNAIIGTVTVSHNITARKHYEEALRKSEERFHLAVQGSNDGLWDWQLDTGETYFSPRWKSMLGYAAEEIPDSYDTWKGLVHPDDVEKAERAMKNLFASNANHFEEEFRMRHKDGRHLSILSRGTLVRNAQGKPIRFVGTHVDITERKKAETVLKEKLQLQDQLAKIAETVPGMICSFLLRPDGSACMPFTTTMIEQIYGLRPEDVARDAGRVFAIIHPEDAGYVRQTITESARTLAPWHDEYRVQHPTRGEIWIEGLSKPQRQEDGSILWHGFVTDVTERKLAEQRVQKAFESMADAQRLAHVGSWEFTLGPSEQFADDIWWSDECYRVFGFEPGSLRLTHESIQHCILPIDLEKVLQREADAVQHGREYSQDYRIVRSDGSIRHIAEHALIVRDEHTGRALKITGTVRDITERVEANRALRESEKRFRSYVENAPLGVLVSDENARITDANPTSAVLLGYPTSELIGMQIRTLIPEDDRVEATKNFQYFLSTGRFEKELRLTRGDGATIWVFLVAVAIAHNRFLGYCIETTQRKRAEEQLRTSLHEKEVLLQEVHHRVKNNLQVISSLLSLQAHQIDDAGARTAIEESRHRVRSMALIHENLYRSENLANIRFDEYIRVVSTELWRSFNMAGVKKVLTADAVTLELDKAVPCGLIVNEILTNALKHAFPDNRTGTVTIVLSQSAPSSIRLTISDDGIGFPVDAEFRSMTSMGMTLILSLTQQVGGIISLERRGGTTFVFEFPV